MHRINPCLVLLLSLLVLAFIATATPPAAAQTTAQKQAAAKKELTHIKQQIKKVTRQTAQTQQRHGKLEKQLALQTKKLNEAAAKARQSNQALAKTQAKIRDLEAQQKQAQRDITSRQQALSQLIRADYMVPEYTDLRLLLGNTDPTERVRLITYANYFRKSHNHKINALKQQSNHLQALEADIQQQQKELEAKRKAYQANKHTLEVERAKKQQLLSKLNTQLSHQHNKIQSLENDQKALKTLIDKLTRITAKQATKTHTPFKQLRGHLPWPLKGTSTASNHGLHIHAPAGSDVHAVAAGRVVYAHKLRGYGLLVIIDHGDDWMSLYGDNESLTCHVGDQVSPGDVISTAGTGAEQHSGIYFGLRHNGKAINPAPWLKK